MKRNVKVMLTKLRIMLADFLAVIGQSWSGHWSSLGPGEPDGVWDKTAGDKMLEVAETAHPIFRASSTLERGNYEAKEEARGLSISMVVNKSSN